METKLFKTNGLLFLLAAGLILTSCSKSSTTKDDLVGTWGSASYTVTSTVGNTSLLQYLTDDLGIPAAQAQIIAGSVTSGLQQSLPGSIQVKSDNTFTATSSGGSETGTWSLSSDNKELTIVPSTGDPITFEIISLSSNTLHLQWSETENEDLNNDGTPEMLNFAIDLMLSK